MSRQPTCPATTTEFNGEKMTCVLEPEHEEPHTDGCCSWNDPWGEIDADQHAAYLKARSGSLG